MQRLMCAKFGVRVVLACHSPSSILSTWNSMLHVTAKAFCANPQPSNTCLHVMTIVIRNMVHTVITILEAVVRIGTIFIM